MSIKHIELQRENCFRKCRKELRLSSTYDDDIKEIEPKESDIIRNHTRTEARHFSTFDNIREKLNKSPTSFSPITNNKFDSVNRKHKHF